MTDKIRAVELAKEYLGSSPYFSDIYVGRTHAIYGDEAIIGLAGLLYTTEGMDSFSVDDIRKFLNMNMSEEQLSELHYYARAFPEDAKFVYLYFDFILLKEEVSPENPHIILRNCPFRICPIEISERVAEKALLCGIHHTYIIAELCKEGCVVNMNLITDEDEFPRIGLGRPAKSDFRDSGCGTQATAP